MRATGDFTPAGSGTRSRSDLLSSPSTASMGTAPHPSQQSQVPQPKRSQDVDELIHFVRNYQGLQRETTDLRLKRHTLLPGIGQQTASDPGDYRLRGVQEEDRVDGGSYRQEDSGDSDLETELPSAQDRRRTPSPPPLWRSDPNPLSSASTASTHFRYAPDKRASSHRLQNSQGPRHAGSLHGGVGGTRAGRRVTADVHQLPPIQFQDIPERPEAPGPGGGGGGEISRERPKSAGLRRRRQASLGDSFTDRLITRSDDDDGDPVDYIE